MSVDKETINTAQKDEKEDPLQSKERRDAMQKLGRISVYVPAAVVTLLASKRASAFSEPPPPDD